MGLEWEGFTFHMFSCLVELIFLASYNLQIGYQCSGLAIWFSQVLDFSRLLDVCFGVSGVSESQSCTVDFRHRRSQPQSAKSSTHYMGDKTSTKTTK